MKSAYFINKATGERLTAEKASEYKFNEIELIEVETCDQSWSYSVKVDWQAFRREAAKDILCALGSRMALGDDIVKISVEYADRLIEQLREEKK